MNFIFGRTKKIEAEIDLFLKEISEGTLHFRYAIEAFLKDNVTEFEKRVAEVRQKEHLADELKKKIEVQMYEYTLLPEGRGDVLAILENTDEVIDIMKNTLVDYAIEKPVINKVYHDDFKVLVSRSMACVEELIKGVYAFFHSLSETNAYIDKVHFYETESDRFAEELKIRVFASDDALEQKSHLRYFINRIDRIADYAEAVSDRLMIYVIKRKV